MEKRKMSYEIPAAEELTVRFEENFMDSDDVISDVPGGNGSGDDE